MKIWIYEFSKFLNKFSTVYHYNSSVLINTMYDRLFYISMNYVVISFVASNKCVSVPTGAVVVMTIWLLGL